MRRIIPVLLLFLFLCGCGEDHSGELTTAKKNLDLCPVLENDTQYSRIITEKSLGIEGESYVNLQTNDQYVALYGFQPTGEMIGDAQVVTDCFTLIDRESLEQTCYVFDWADVDEDSSLAEMDFLDGTSLLILCAELKDGVCTYDLWVYNCTKNTFAYLAALNTTRSQEDAVCDMRCMGQNIYITFTHGDILCYDMESGEEKIISCGLFSSELVCSEQGDLYAVGTDGGIVEAVPISTEDNSVGAAVSLIESTWYQVCDGFENYDFYITYENQICGISMADGTMTIVFDGYASGVDLNHVRFFTVGTTLLICDNVTDDFLVDDYELYTLEPQSVDDDQRVTLTLATLSTSSDLQEAVVEFNKENADYIIELEDYSEYGDNGATRLYADIMSGNIPDILNLSGLQETSIYSDEYLLDLLPYMQGSYGEELDGIQTSVIQAQMSGEQLLTVTPNYNLKILCSLTSVGTELTTDLFCDLLDQGKEKGMISRNEVMEILFENTVAEFIDASSNTLEGDALQELLTRAKPFPDVAETDGASVAEGLYSGNILFASTELSSFRSFRQLIYDLGDEITIYGYPGITEDAVVLEANNFLAITTATSHPDVAWEFILTMLEPEFQRKYSHRTFPLATDVLDELVLEAESSETGFSEGAAAMLDEMFSTISLGSVGCSAIRDIITEEAQAYFSGDKSREDVVEIIQNRVHIYLSEQS